MVLGLRTAHDVVDLVDDVIWVARCGGCRGGVLRHACWPDVADEDVDEVGGRRGLHERRKGFCAGVLEMEGAEEEATFVRSLSTVCEEKYGSEKP